MSTWSLNNFLKFAYAYMLFFMLICTNTTGKTEEAKTFFRITEPKKPAERERAQQWFRYMNMREDMKSSKFSKDSALCEDSFHWMPATLLERDSKTCGFLWRSSQPQVLYKIDVLKDYTKLTEEAIVCRNFEKFAGKHL